MAAVELALLLPLLVFACMAAVDFARVMYAMVTLQNCARNGALYEFYSAAGCSLPSGWTSLSAAVQADAGNLTVTVPSTYSGNSNPYSPQASSSNYVTVTVQCNFTLLDARQRRRVPVDRQHDDADPVGLDADAPVGRGRALSGASGGRDASASRGHSEVLEMIRRNPRSGDGAASRRSSAPSVYPVAILLLMGTLIMGLGVFRYQQLQFLAREGARYASVHGPTYASESGQSKASTSTVLTYVQGMAVGLDGLNCTAVNYSVHDHALHRQRDTHLHLDARTALQPHDVDRDLDDAGDLLTRTAATRGRTGRLRTFGEP